MGLLSHGCKGNAFQRICKRFEELFFKRVEIGGTVLFGITDDGKIVGQEVATRQNAR